MRQLLRDLAASVLLLAGCPSVAAAQPGSLQLSASAHSTVGDPGRIAGEQAFEPDVGVTWLQPGTRFGLFQMEIRGTRRGDQLHLGKAFVAFRDVAYRGIAWSFEGGDTYFVPGVGEYRFSNLATPSLTFAGGAVRARTPRAEVNVMVGRATAWRNVFGTDAQTLDQDVAVARGRYKASDRLDLSTRVSRVRTRDLAEFDYSIAASDEGGLGARLILTPAIHLVADGSVVSYRRRDSDFRELDGSAIVGASVLLARGWVQLNAARFSPGELPILNQPLADRQTLFAAGEYDLQKSLRLFAGWEAFESNLDPEASAAASGPRTAADGTRGFGGFLVRLGARSSVSLRAEQGDRRSRLVGAALTRVSDTGVVSAEWHTALGQFNGFARYSRRDNVESALVDGNFTQQDSSAYLLFSPSRTLQIFSNAVVTRNTLASGGGSTFWQVGAGAQTQLRSRSLWVRAEGTLSRNIDMLTERFVPRESLNLGLNGQIAGNTILGLNVYADRLTTFGQPEDSWIARSSLRLTRVFPTTGGRSSTSIAGSMTRHGGTGALIGVVFSDWNANGLQDPGEEPLQSIPVRLANLGGATTSRAGEFAFLDVPIGLMEIGIDTTALPVDFDPPAVPQVQIDLARGDTRRVAFGLVPLGSVRGRVVRDDNSNGRADEGEESIDGAVLVMDGGARSEAVRKGWFRFDAVRSGAHAVQLLADSLPAGAAVIGAGEATVQLGRGALDVELTFLAAVSKRAEVRRVFTPRGAPSIDRPSTPAPATVPRSRNAEGSARATAPPAQQGRFAIQVAALNDPARARELVERLRSAGHPSYLVAPPAADPDAPYKVRVGHYPTRSAAEPTLKALEKELGEKLWIVREVTGR